MGIGSTARAKGGTEYLEGPRCDMDTFSVGDFVDGYVRFDLDSAIYADNEYDVFEEMGEALVGSGYKLEDIEYSVVDATDGGYIVLYVSGTLV